jgi:hypothetical protein
MRRSSCRSSNLLWKLLVPVAAHLMLVPALPRAHARSGEEKSGAPSRPHRRKGIVLGTREEATPALEEEGVGPARSRPRWGARRRRRRQWEQQKLLDRGKFGLIRKYGVCKWASGRCRRRIWQICGSRKIVVANF